MTRLRFRGLSDASSSTSELDPDAWSASDSEAPSEYSFSLESELSFPEEDVWSWRPSPFSSWPETLLVGLTGTTAFGTILTGPD